MLAARRCGRMASDRVSPRVEAPQQIDRVDLAPLKASPSRSHPDGSGWTVLDAQTGWLSKLGRPRRMALLSDRFIVHRRIWRRRTRR